MQERRETLKRTFDSAATLYDSRRPGYPQALINDVIQLSRIPHQGNILEIGCGTGQATKPFADFGYRLICLELGMQLADTAKRKFQNYDNVTIIAEPFESWDPGSQKYHLIIAATSFHWLDPAIRYIKAAQILYRDGALAVFTNKHVRKNEGFFAEVQSIYHKIAYPSQTKIEISRPPETDRGVDLFEEPITKLYPWDERYTADEYLALLGTYSDHISLPTPDREKLFQAVRELINHKYAGFVIKHYESKLELRRKKEQAGACRMPLAEMK